MTTYTPSSSGRSSRRRRLEEKDLPDRGKGGSPESHVQCRICHRWFQAITYTHLRYRHGIEIPREYKEEYSLSKITSQEVRSRIAEKKFLVDRHALDYIRRSWGKRSIKEITTYLGIHASTVRAHARRMGLGLLVEQWDPGKILQALRKARRQGIPLNSGNARQRLGKLYRAAITYWRSWKEALRAAGIPYEGVALRGPFESWTRERIMSEARDLNRRGRDLDYSYIQEHHPKLYAAARNHFGNWKAARRAAGLPDPKAPS